jgi:hypothetical protein
MNELPLFDAIASKNARDAGIEQAAQRKKSLLKFARTLAVELAQKNGTVTADDVYKRLIEAGIPERAMGNSAGAIFIDGRFEWTGRYHKSTRVIGHGNLQRIWRLKDGQ